MRERFIPENLDPAREAIEERLYHSLTDMVKFAEEKDLYFEPGTGFQYSNLAYNLLAYIAECVANKPFDLLLAERIFDPLEMRSTKQYDAAVVERNLAKGYEYKLLNGFEKASFYDPSYTVGPGGLISTVDDLYKFDQALYARKFISADLYGKMFLPSPHGSYAYILMQKGDYINSIKYYKTGLRVLKKYPRINSSDSVLKDAENALMSIKEMEGKIKKRDD